MLLVTGLLAGALIDCLALHIFSPLVWPSPCILGPCLHPYDCLIEGGEGPMVGCSFSLSELSCNVSTDEYSTQDPTNFSFAKASLTSSPH